MAAFANRLGLLCCLLLPAQAVLAQSVRRGDNHTGLDWLIVAFGAVVVVAVLVLTIKYLVRPGEKGSGHIKRKILKDDWQDGNDGQ